MTCGHSIVVVGAGISGVRACRGLRASGFEGPLVLVSAESELPYDRPPLSKQILATGHPGSAIALEPESFYVDNRIELMLGERVQSIDRQRRRVALQSGAEVEFSRMVLALGSQLRTLPLLGRGAAGVFYLRDIDDARGLRAAMQTGGRVAIIGGGVIGLEVAAAAAIRKLPVTVIEAAPRLMARAAPRPLAEHLAAVHRDHGVTIRCGTTVQSVTGRGPTRCLHLSDGATVEADILVVGVGVEPRIDLAVAAQIETAPQGIRVDGFGRTSDPAIYAAGECTYHFNSFSGCHVRQENWHHAAAHGEHVGRSIVEPQIAYNELCGYWSDQYHVSIQATGAQTGEVDVVRGDVAGGKFIVLHVTGRFVIGATAVNATRELRAAKNVIRQRVPVDPEKLSDARYDLAVLAA